MLVKDVLDTFDGKLPIFEVQVKDKLESINENYHIEFITLQFLFCYQIFELKVKKIKNANGGQIIINC